jgi:hypothetical protein
MFIFYICTFATRAYAYTYPWPVTLRKHDADRVGFVDAAWQLVDQTGLGLLLVIPMAIEMAFLLAAFLLFAWAAQPEPIGQTLRRTLRTVWLSSTTWILAGLLPLGAWQWNELLRRQTAIPWPNTTTGRVIVKPDSPWILHERNAEALIYLAIVAAAFWIFWCLIRALRTPTHLSCPILPPTCESCGYNLSHISDSGRCPECGTSTESSLAPNRRPLIPDHSFQPFQTFFSPLRISQFAGLVPKRIFSSLPVFSCQASAQHFGLFWAGCLAVLVMGVPIVVQQWIENPRPVADYGPWPLGIDLIPFAMAALLFPLVVAGGVASGLGMWQSVVDQRNQLPAAAKAAFYNADFLAVWGMAALLIYFFRDFPFPQIHNPSVFQIAYVIETNRAVSGRIGQFVFLLIGFGWYVYLVRRAMREMRFANH